MLAFCAIAIGIIIGLTDVFVLKKNTSVKKVIATVLIDTVGINLVLMTFFGLLLKL